MMTKKIIVITGASDGIGAAGARALHALGHHVILVGRSAEKTKSIAGELKAPYFLADFADLDDVRSLANQLKEETPRIDVLANNAGGIMGNRRVTVDGNELTIQVNHLAPFLLTNLLLETLIGSRATVIATSSLANRAAGTLDLNDLSLEHGYSPQSAYGKAKLMNILFSKELHRRFHGNGIAAASFHPGIVRTGFAGEFRGPVSFAYTSLFKYLFRSPGEGADSLVWLATSEPDRDWQSGEYFKNRRLSKANKQAYRQDLATQLWALSMKATNRN